MIGFFGLDALNLHSRTNLGLKIVETGRLRVHFDSKCREYIQLGE